MLKLQAHVPSDLAWDESANAKPGARSLIAAAALGLIVLYVVGFAAPHAIHEAAHDARHTLNFPCH